MACAALWAPLGWGAGFSTSAQGTTTAEFLRLGVGGRAISMGGAYTAVTDDAGSLYWNPAGLSRIESRSATFMHAAYLGTSYYDYAAYGRKSAEGSALGLGLQYFSAGALPQTDDTGTGIGNFSPYDLAASVGYAYTFEEWPVAGLQDWSAGLAGKFIRSKILSSAQTEAVDFGVLSPGYFGGKLRLALAAANIGGKMKFEAESEELPMTFKVGGASQLTENWLASVDVCAPKDDKPYAAVGTEYWLVTGGPLRLAGRAGFNSETVGKVEGLTGATFGIGLVYGGASMDYAFAPMGALGMTHRISLSFKWEAARSTYRPELNIEAPEHPILLLK